jgi:hypothetical protein
VAHDLGRSFKAWLASLLSPSLYGEGGADALNTEMMVTPGTRSSVARGTTTATSIPVML